LPRLGLTKSLFFELFPTSNSPACAVLLAFKSYAYIHRIRDIESADEAAGDATIFGVYS